MSIELTMPRLSDTMETGTIIKWNVKEGDKVSSGDVVADIETDKATMEMTAFDDGVVAKIAVPEGKAVPVGTVIAVLEGGSGKAKSPSDKQNEKQSSAPPPTAKGASSKPSDRAPEKMAEDDTALPKPAAKAAEADESKGRTAASVDAGRGEPKQQAKPPGHARDGEEEESPREHGGRVRVSPLARHLAEDHGVDLNSIEGSGPGGRIIKRDVLAAVDAKKETGAAVVPAARRTGQEQSAGKSSQAGALAVPVRRRDQEDDEGPVAPMVQSRTVPLSQMRQVIAKRLVESKTTIPHYQVTMTVAMDTLLDLRKDLNAQLESQGVKLSVNDFIVRACAIAMHRHPEFNSSWGGDSVVIHGDVNVGVAIALSAERGGGLVVATIRNADQKSLRIISWETKMLGDKARTRGLSIEEMADTTFTVSNLGMFGVDHFTAIINPPNSAILAVGAAIEKPVVRDHQLVVGHEMSATLSCDHRVIDGATAAQYLQTVKGLLEQPAGLLV